MKDNSLKLKNKISFSLIFNTFFSFWIICLYYELIFIILYLILINIGNFFFPEQISKFLLWNIHHVTSNSMSPTISQNDYIIVKNIKKETENLKIGDIIVFSVSEEYQEEEDLKQIPFVVHRIIKIDQENKNIQTKGDNNKESGDFEKKINYNQVLSKVIFPIRLSKILSYKILNKMNMLILFIFIFYTFMFFYLKKQLVLEF